MDRKRHSSPQLLCVVTNRGDRLVQGKCYGSQYIFVLKFIVELAVNS